MLDCHALGLPICPAAFYWILIAGSGARKMHGPENRITAGTLLKPFWNPAGTVLAPWWNCAGTLREICCNLAGTPCWNVPGCDVVNPA